MGYLRHRKVEAQNQSSLHQNSQRIIKFLLSVSLFSVLSSSLPFLLHSLNAFLMKLCSYSILKICMFLIYNGLLVFIAKNSGLIDGSSSPATYQTEEIVKSNVGASASGESESKELEITEPTAGENGKEIEIPVGEEKSLTTVQQTDEILNSEEKGEEDEGEGKEIMIIEEYEKEEEETEELNKKCEDFIRKMKAAFCSEPRTYNYEFDHQRAIMAN